jgi:hypothetical protein
MSLLVSIKREHDMHVIFWRAETVCCRMPQFMGVLWMHMCNCACCTCTCTLPVARRKRPHAHRARKSQVMRFFSACGQRGIVEVV